MAMLEQIESYISSIFIITLVLLAVFVILFIYLFKIKKITAKEEIVNYDNFYRKDAVEYLPFRCLITKDGHDTEGIIDLGNNTYVAGLDIVGYNYAAASAEERQRTMMNSISLANVIEKPIQFRQSVRAVDLQENIELYKEYKENLMKEHDNLAADFNECLKLVDDNPDNEELLRETEPKLALLHDAIETKKWQIEECDTLIRYQEFCSDRDNDAQKVNQMLYTYVYDPNDSTEEYTREMIELKAMRELDTMTVSYKNALEACGCRARRLTGDDLVMLLRQHSSPFGADDTTIEDLLGSSYNSVFVTSDSLVELEKARLSEEEYKKNLEELERQRNEILRNQYVERERNARNIRKTLNNQFGVKSDE